MSDMQKNGVLSMTGFANVSVLLVEHEGQQCSVDIEIKSFNSKFFEPTCKLPSLLSPYEMELVAKLKAGLVRGRVYCTVRVNSHGALLEKMVFSPLRVEEYMAASVHIQKQYGVQGALSVFELMSLPQVFSAEKAPLSDEALARFMAGVDQAIAQTCRMRKAEGEALLHDLLKRLAMLRATIDHVEAIVTRLLTRHKEEIAQLQRCVQEGDEAAKILLPERLGALDKMDVHEEIVRFRAHGIAIEKLLADPSGEKGRRLDFILQELMREVNTITAKCTNYDMSTSAVDIKVEIEKIREQVQNIV